MPISGGDAEGGCALCPVRTSPPPGGSVLLPASFAERVIYVTSGPVSVRESVCLSVLSIDRSSSVRRLC